MPRFSPSFRWISTSLGGAHELPTIVLGPCGEGLLLPGDCEVFILDSAITGSAVGGLTWAGDLSVLSGDLVVLRGGDLWTVSVTAAAVTVLVMTVAATVLPRGELTGGELPWWGLDGGELPRVVAGGGEPSGDDMPCDEADFMEVAGEASPEEERRTTF